MKLTTAYLRALAALSLPAIVLLGAAGSATPAQAAPPQQLPPPLSQTPAALRPGPVAACEGGPETCNPGFFWRNALSGDHVCVTAAVRDQVLADNRADAARLERASGTSANSRVAPRGDKCPAGLVWRLSSRTDHVCVTNAAEAQAAADNAAAASRIVPECKPPPGSYRDSCTQIVTNGVTLTAKCMNAAGTPTDARLDSQGSCQGDILNVDGTLRCNRGGPAPVGSYLSNCPLAWTETPTDLAARCKQNGVTQPWGFATLPAFRQCTGDIFFAYSGGLHCQRGPLPPGSYPATCRQIWVDGNRLHAYCDTGSGYGNQTMLLDIAACHQPIINDHGGLRCGPAPLGPMVAVPRLVASTLAKAKADIKSAGLVTTRMDSSCVGLETLLLVAGQSVAPATMVAKGSSVDITRCVPSPVSDSSPQGCSGGVNYVTVCADCGGYTSELPGYTCLSESDVITALQPQFANCTIHGGRCP